MTGRSVPVTVETGNADTAREVAEGALKPEATIALADEEAIARTVAHYSKIYKQALADAPGLRLILETKLRHGVMQRLEDSVVAGSGVAPNLRGVLNTPGIGVVEYDGAELIGDQLLRGIVTVTQANAEARAVVLNPLDWQAALIAKAAGDGHYFSGGPFTSQVPAVWGVPMIASNALPQGTAIVGDFGAACALWIREGVQVLVSDSDQDDFVKNIVTVLAELRAAFAVLRPAAFAVVELADPEA